MLAHAHPAAPSSSVIISCALLLLLIRATMYCIGTGIWLRTVRNLSYTLMPRERGGEPAEQTHDDMRRPE